jgi:hypothetical protein
MQGMSCLLYSATTQQHWEGVTSTKHNHKHSHTEGAAAVGHLGAWRATYCSDCSKLQGCVRRLLEKLLKGFPETTVQFTAFTAVSHLQGAAHVHAMTDSAQDRQLAGAQQHPGTDKDRPSLRRLRPKLLKNFLSSQLEGEKHLACPNHNLGA